MVATRGRRRWRRGPALLAAVVVGVLLVAGAGCSGRRPQPAPSSSGAAPSSPTVSPSPSPQPGADLTGPLNVLLVGVDTRVSVPGWEPHADAVLLMHIDQALDRAYLFSLPRDLVVDIPAFPKAKFRGQRTKLTHAMTYGSRPDGRKNAPDTAQGFELLAETVSDYTGIERFDAGAVITFTGFDRLVDALGGVDITVDQRVVSLHRQPDGRHRAPSGSGYVGPRMVYEKGPRHMVGWQALDYARQRYITGGDYSRQRHQQQLIKAIVAALLDQGVPRDPARLDAVLAALGDTVTFVGHGRRVVDFAFALSRLTPSAMTLVALPGDSVGQGGSYRGEQLTETGRRFLTELRAGRADAYLAEHPKL
ncbi:MAG TPA: LCP family protein, partial [Micromonospora sp.]